jgi:hypothetical protein
MALRLLTAFRATGRRRAAERPGAQATTGRPIKGDPGWAIAAMTRWGEVAIFELLALAAIGWNHLAHDPLDQIGISNDHPQ